MSNISVTACCPVCNQSSFSSRVVFRSTGRIARLRITAILLRRALALAVVARGGALSQHLELHLHPYLETLTELIDTALGQIADVLEVLHLQEPEI